MELEFEKNVIIEQKIYNLNSLKLNVTMQISVKILDAHLNN